MYIKKINTASLPASYHVQDLALICLLNQISSSNMLPMLKHVTFYFRKSTQILYFMTLTHKFKEFYEIHT